MFQRWMDEVDAKLTRLEEGQQTVRDMAISLKYLFWTAIGTGLINVGTTLFKLMSGQGH